MTIIEIKKLKSMLLNSFDYLLFSKLKKARDIGLKKLKVIQALELIISIKLCL